MRHKNYVIACSRHIYMGVFYVHIPFMVNRTFNAIGGVATTPLFKCNCKFYKQIDDVTMRLPLLLCLLM